MEVEEVVEDQLEVEDETEQPEVNEDEETESEEQSEEEVETKQDEEGSEEESEDDEVVITLGDEETPPQEEDEGKHNPELVKKLRKLHKEQARENRELKAQLEALTKVENKPIELGPKPKLSDYDYDEDEFDKAIDEWHQNKLVYEQEQQNIKKEQEAQQEAWNNRLEVYSEHKDKLKVKDFEESEYTVTTTLNPTQQGMIVEGADNPAALVYALGKHPGKLKELASIESPVKFAFEVAKLEAKMKVTTRKSPPPPEKKVKGNGSLSGTVDSTLERLRSEAEKTGDYSKVIAYKRKKKT